MQNPKAHRETLHQMAAALHTEGLIDQFEQFDMNEMADAPLWYAAEELQNSPGQYCGASPYDVGQIDTGRLLGNISRSIINFESDAPRGASFPCDGKVYSDADGARLLGSLPEDWDNLGPDAGTERAPVPVDRDRTGDQRRRLQTYRRPRRIPRDG
ncbi:hypothetical protein ACXR0M_19425 [Pseudomonas sp. Eth.TT006]